MKAEKTPQRQVRWRNILPLALILLVGGCNPLYIIEAAVHEGRILANRKPIKEVIARGEVNAADARALTLVTEARLFAQTRGLSVGENFTSFSPTDEDNLVWVVMGCKPDSFDMKRWWFPIVGTVPYKGFFSKDAALRSALDLQQAGFETFVRGAAAFSTLGWFNDPVLTPIIRNPPAVIINTVIHELVHSTIWIRNDVAFNESLANYVGLAETLAFFMSRHPLDRMLHQEASQQLTREISISALSEQLYRQLTVIYSSPSAQEEKLRLKRAAFAAIDAKARAIGSTLGLFGRANNAEFLQAYLYLRRLELFDALYRHKNGDLSEFLAAIREFQETISDTIPDSQNLFDLFEQFVHSTIHQPRPDPTDGLAEQLLFETQPIG